MTPSPSPRPPLSRQTVRLLGGLLALLIGLTGCVSSHDIGSMNAGAKSPLHGGLTDAQLMVRVTTNPAASAGCHYLGLIYTTKAATEAYREGEFHVLGEKMGANLVWYGDSERKTGEAYRCSTSFATAQVGAVPVEPAVVRMRLTANPQAVPADCKFRGRVTTPVYDYNRTTSPDTPLAVRDRLLQEAQHRGANFLLYDGTSAQAEAYLCPDPAAAVKP